MGKKGKRRHRDDSPPPSSSRHDHRSQNPHHPSSARPRPASSDPNHHRTHPLQQSGKRPAFASFIDTPNLPPKVKVLCEIIAITPSSNVDKVLDDTGVRVSQQDVEEVLKLSYACPGSAVKFFRWAGCQLKDNHSPYAWNLVVDMLGKNCLFDAMWDAIKSMKKEGLISLATFASVFSSYVLDGKVHESVMTFEVMNQYGCPQDIVAVNSLLSAICRDGKTVNAKEVLTVLRGRIRPDADTYAILLEGWEKEKDVVNARQTFQEMVIEIGWDPSNVPAYDSLLTTVLKGSDGMREVMKLLDVLEERRCYPGLKFFKLAIDECVKKGDVKAAKVFWDAMVVRNVCKPDTEMYNWMISLYSLVKDTDQAGKLFDEMVYYGVFPDSKTYNQLLQFMLKSRKLKEAQTVFTEMMMNEFVPSHENCSLAIRVFVHGGDPYMAIKVWKCMIENYKSDLEESGNLLITGLIELNRLPEAVKYAEDMIDRWIKVSSATLSKLRQSLGKANKGPVFDDLLRKWKR